MRATLPIQSVLMVVFFYRLSRLCIPASGSE
jgi:hypothetical protein